MQQAGHTQRFATLSGAAAAPISHTSGAGLAASSVAGYEHLPAQLTISPAQSNTTGNLPHPTEQANP